MCGVFAADRPLLTERRDQSFWVGTVCVVFSLPACNRLSSGYVSQLSGCQYRSGKPNVFAWGFGAWVYRDKANNETKKTFLKAGSFLGVHSGVGAGRVAIYPPGLLHNRRSGADGSMLLCFLQIYSGPANLNALLFTNLFWPRKQAEG